MLILPSSHNTFTLAQRRVLRKRTPGRTTLIKSARQTLLVFQITKLQKVKITVLKRFSPSEVFPESPVTPVGPMETCELRRDRQEFIAENLQMPKGFCTSAWVSIYGNVRLLAFGGNLPWFKEKGVAINCCSDGARDECYDFLKKRFQFRFPKIHLKFVAQGKIEAPKTLT